MDQGVVVALIAILPQLVLFVLAGALAVRFRQPLGRLIEERVSSVSALGFKVDLRPAEVNKAVQDRMAPAMAVLAADSATNELEPTPLGEQVVDRAKRLATRIAGRTILWIDDHIEGNRIERRMLRQMGICAESVTTKDGASAVLNDPADRIDLIISDIGRDDGSPGGLALLDGLRAPQPVILYVGRVERERGIPAGAFGITDRPDELLNLVMDALDR